MSVQSNPSFRELYDDDDEANHLGRPLQFDAGRAASLGRWLVEKGDPTKSGEFVVRLSLPAGYEILAFPSTDEHVRITKGEFLVGIGDALDLAKTMRLAVGDTGTITAKMHHCAIARVATELGIRGEGPFAMTYVNPVDDPRRRTSCLDRQQTKPH